MKKTILGLMMLYAASELALAQDDLSVPPPPNSPGSRLPRFGASGQPTAGPKEKTFDLVFGGGKPKELVEELFLARKESTPVIIPSNATDIVFPAFSLRNVTLTDLFSALNLLGTRENWYWQANQRANSESSPIWVLTREVPNSNRFQNYGLPMQPQPARPEMRVQPVHVGYLLEKYRIEDLTTAIETGWSMAEQSGDGQPPRVDSGESSGLLRRPPPPELKYHKDTQLLLIKGYAGQISFVNELLQQLAGPLKKDAPAVKPPLPVGAPPASPVPK